MTVITHDLVQKYIKDKVKYPGYEETVDIAEHLSFHIDGFKPPSHHRNDIQNMLDRMVNPHLHSEENRYFHLLIDDRRPAESIKFKTYRRKIWANITKPTMFKVISSLNKIVRAEDWKIDYSKSEKPSTIRDEEQLEVYAERKYPFFGSIENWAYNFGLKKVLADPNGLIVVMPVNFKVETNEHFSPFGTFVKSKDIRILSEDLLIYKSNITGTFVSDGVETPTPIYYLLNKTEIWTSQKIDDKDTMSLDLVHTHNFEVIPAFKLGGNPVNIVDNITIFESFLNPMLPPLDEAAREYSDLQAEVVQHTHSTMWGIAGQDCNTCNGIGKVTKDGKPVACGDCKGEGVMPMSPYKNITIKRPKIDDNPLPIPPVGYIEKNTEIVKIQTERVEAHLMKALSSLNMEFLGKVPLNESGKAKEIDKEELNNFIYSVGYHLVVNTIRPLYAWVTKWRYATIITQKETRIKMLPMIVIPEQFNLISESLLVEQIRQAQDANMDSTIIDELQVDYINKKFRHDPMLRDKLKCINDLNPFSSSTKDQVSDMVMERIITQKDAVIYTYINSFVEEAIIEDEDFLDKDLKEKKEIINKMADAKLAQITAVTVEVPPVEE